MANTIKIKQIDQTQLAAFVNDILDGTGAVYTANRALVTDGSGDVTTSSVTATELGYLSGVTSAIQTQFNNLGSTYLALAGGTMTGALTLDAASLLKFGGATSSYPALKRSSTELQVRLADDSGYAGINAASYTFSGGASLNYNGSEISSGYRILSSTGLVSEGYLAIGPWPNYTYLYAAGADIFEQRRTANAQTFRVYGTYTDASNYVRASLATTSTSVTLAAQTAGTGADNIDINITPAGTGLVQLGSGANKATVDQYGQVSGSGGGTLTNNSSGSFGAFQICWGNSEGIGYGGTIFRSGFRLTWSQYGNQAQAGMEDAGLARNAAGVVEVNNGTPGTYRDIKVRNFYFGDSAYLIFNGSRTYSSHNFVAPAIVVGSVEPIDVILERDASAILALRNSTNAQTFRVYGAYTDASNYVRASLAATSTSVTLAAQTAGTGADDIDINITPAGAGSVKLITPIAFNVGNFVKLLDMTPAGAPDVYIQYDGSRAISFSDCFSTHGSDVGKKIRIASNCEFGFSSGTTPSQDANDVIIAREAADTLSLRRTTNAQTLRVYGTYTDASNYVRASLAATSTSVTLAAQTAGTGADDIDINITSAGNGGIVLNTEYRVALNGSSLNTHFAIVAPGVNVRFTQDAVGSYVQRGFAIATDGAWRFTVGDNTVSKKIGIQSDYLLGWVSGNVTATNPTLDTAIARNSAGVVEVNNGTAGTYRDLRLRTITVDAVDGNGLQFNGGGSVEAYSSYLTLTSPYTGFVFYSPQVGANVLITDNVSATFNLDVMVAATKTFGWTGTGCSLTGVSDLGLTAYSGFVFTTTGGTSRRVGSLDNDGALRLYGAYTDASNYVRASLAATSTAVTLAAETAGTGADNIDINITPAGAGQTVVTGLYAHREFSTAYSNGKMIQATGVEGRTVTFGTVSGQAAIAFGTDLTTNFTSNGYIYGHSGCLNIVGGGNNIRFGNSIEIGYPATFFVAAGGGVTTRNYLAICDSAAVANDGGDVVLRRDAANILALRNASNGQKFRVYGDYTGASQYAALEFSVTQTGGDYFSHYIGPVNAGGSDYWNDNRGTIGGWAFLTIDVRSHPSSDAGTLEFQVGNAAIRDTTLGGYLAFFDGRSYTSTGQYGHRNYFNNPNTASHTLGLWQPNGHTKSALTVYTNSVLKAEITSAGAFNSYGAWTDDSNYVRASLSAASTSVTLAAQTAGTGADDIDVNLRATGTGAVTVGNGSNQFSFYIHDGNSNCIAIREGGGLSYFGTVIDRDIVLMRNSVRAATLTANGFMLGNASDTGISRNAAGVVEVNDGTAGTFRDLKLRDIYHDGQAARSISMARHTTSDTAGSNLTVQAGGATSGATNKAGGYLDLVGGISTGTGEGGVRIKGYVAGSSGTSDNSASTMIEVLSNKIGFFGVTPVIRQTTGIAAATFVANTSAIADDTATWGGYTAGQIVTALKNVGILT